MMRNMSQIGRLLNTATVIDNTMTGANLVELKYYTIVEEAIYEMCMNMKDKDGRLKHGLALSLGNNLKTLAGFVAIINA